MIKEKHGPSCGSEVVAVVVMVSVRRGVPSEVAEQRSTAEGAGAPAMLHPAVEAAAVEHVATIAQFPHRLPLLELAQTDGAAAAAAVAVTVVSRRGERPVDGQRCGLTAADAQAVVEEEDAEAGAEGVRDEAAQVAQQEGEAEERPREEQLGVAADGEPHVSFFVLYVFRLLASCGLTYK